MSSFDINNDPKPGKVKTLFKYVWNLECFGLKPLGILFILLNFCSLIILSIGVGLYVFSQVYVPVNIKRFNSFIDKWDHTYRKPFSSLYVRVNISSETTPFYIVSLYRVDREYILRDNFPEIHSFHEDLFRNYFFERTFKYSADSTFSLQISIRDPKHNRWEYLNRQYFSLWKLVEIGFQKEDCLLGGGWLINDKCYWLYRLSTFCVKIKNYRSPQVSYKYGGVGCVPYQNWFSPTWYPMLFTQVYNKGNQSLGSIEEYFSVQGSVKSENSPLLLAYNMTKGKLDFTKYEEFGVKKYYYIGMTLFVVGIVAVLTITAALIIMCCFRNSRRILFSNLSEEQEVIYDIKEKEALLKKYQEDDGENKKKYRQLLFPDKQKDVPN